MTDAVATAGLVNTTTTQASSLSELSEDYERFLTLLTAQIQYQDPLEPMDSTQFVTQLAQLSQVEQAVATNDNLELLGGQIGSLVSVAGADLVGREVTILSDQFSLDGGTTDALYRVDEGTSRVTGEIRDADGVLVRTISGLSTDSSEIQEFVWDGRDDAGNLLADGNYSLALSAFDAEGNPMNSYTYRTAEVMEVLFTGGTNYFNLDSGEQVSADAILAAS